MSCVATCSVTCCKLRDLEFSVYFPSAAIIRFGNARIPTILECRVKTPERVTQPTQRTPKPNQPIKYASYDKSSDTASPSVPVLAPAQPLISQPAECQAPIRLILDWGAIPSGNTTKTYGAKAGGRQRLTDTGTQCTSEANHLNSGRRPTAKKTKSCSRSVFLGQFAVDLAVGTTL